MLTGRLPKQSCGCWTIRRMQWWRLLLLHTPDFLYLAAYFMHFYFAQSLILYTFAQDRWHLGNKNKLACFVLHSICTIFAPDID